MHVCIYGISVLITANGSPPVIQRSDRYTIFLLKGSTITNYVTSAAKNTQVLPLFASHLCSQKPGIHKNIIPLSEGNQWCEKLITATAEYRAVLPKNVHA